MRRKENAGTATSGSSKNNSIIGTVSSKTPRPSTAFYSNKKGTITPKHGLTDRSYNKGYTTNEALKNSLKGEYFEVLMEL